MANISVTNSMTSNTATSDITLVGTNFTDLVNGLTDGTKDLSISNISIANAIKAANGTVALPGISFTNDLDCGVYRIGANNIGIAVNGVKQVDIATTGITFPNQGGLSATRNTTQSISNDSLTTVLFATEQYDTGSEYDTSTGIFTANLAGVYIACWAVTSASAAWDAAETWYSVISKNNSDIAGSKFYGFVDIAETAATRNMSSTGRATIQLAAADTLRVKVYHNQGAAVNVVGDGLYNYFMVAKVA